MSRRRFSVTPARFARVKELAARGVRETDIAAELGCSLSVLRGSFSEALPADWTEPLAAPLLRVISLGAGVQSSTLVLMAAAGELKPMPDAALFADTHSEPAFVYEHLAWIQSLQLPFPVRVIEGGDLGGDLAAGRFGARVGTYPAIPYFLDSGTKGGGRGVRGCTGPYKILPLAREHRQMLGPQRGNKPRPGSVEVWLGISTDEAHRMKPAQNDWQINRFPLIEADMSRGDCIEWLKRHDYPVPQRSACVFCPYRSDAEWRHLREFDPSGFQSAVQLDGALRSVKGQLGLADDPYLHRSMRPLDKVDFDSATRQRDLFGEECSGLCGN